jgi:hypothetical protein
MFHDPHTAISAIGMSGVNGKNGKDTLGQEINKPTFIVRFQAAHGPRLFAARIVFKKELRMRD